MIIVFAKAPVPGLAKTRLAPALGAEGAARLAERMLRHTVQQALDSGQGPVTLCVTPDTSHPLLAEVGAQPGVSLTLQGEGNLGQRMARAFDQALAQHPCALLIGTDAPALDAAYLRQAADALLTHDAVFGPAADGGYVLVGLRRPAPQLFDNMRWSHDRVLANTRQRLAAAQLSFHELAVLHDIDEAADLVHLPPSWRSSQRC